MNLETKKCSVCGKRPLPYGWVNINGKYCEGHPEEVLENDSESEILQHPKLQESETSEDQIPVILAVQPGELVYLEDNSQLRCRVLKVELQRSGDLMYLVGWWDGNDLKEKWVQPGQIDHKTCAPARVALGFRTESM